MDRHLEFRVWENKGGLAHEALCLLGLGNKILKSTVHGRGGGWVCGSLRNRLTRDARRQRLAVSVAVQGQMIKGLSASGNRGETAIRRLHLECLVCLDL